MGIIVESITALEQINLTRDDLEQTRLGKYVNDIRKILSNPSTCDTIKDTAITSNIAKRAKTLVKRWRDDHLKTISALKIPSSGGTIVDSKKSTDDIRVNGIKRELQNFHTMPPKLLNGHDSLPPQLTDANKNTLIFKSEIVEETHLDVKNPKLVLKIKKQKQNTKRSETTTTPDSHKIPNIAQTTTTAICGASNFPFSHSRKVKTTAEIMAHISSKSKVLKDTPLAPFLQNPPNFELINKSHEQYLKAKKAKKASKGSAYNIPIATTQSIEESAVVPPQTQSQSKKRGRHKKLKTADDNLNLSKILPSDSSCTNLPSFPESHQSTPSSSIPLLNICSNISSSPTINHQSATSISNGGEPSLPSATVSCFTTGHENNLHTVSTNTNASNQDGGDETNKTLTEPEDVLLDFCNSLFESSASSNVLESNTTNFLDTKNDTAGSRHFSNLIEEPNSQQNIETTDFLAFPDIMTRITDDGESFISRFDALFPLVPETEHTEQTPVSVSSAFSPSSTSPQRYLRSYVLESFENEKLIVLPFVDLEEQ